MQVIERNGNKITIFDDGRIEIIDRLGRKYEMAENGIDMALGSIRRIALENIVDVKKYSLSTAEGLTIHDIEYNDGGRISFAFTDDGKIAKYSAKQTGMQITSENDVIISMHSTSLPPLVKP